ncbi:MAG: hypothetical protein K6E51_00995 [Treponema sp.]|nr:hypothetical protein [Treponema sp.]
MKQHIYTYVLLGIFLGISKPTGIWGQSSHTIKSDLQITFTTEQSKEYKATLATGLTYTGDVTSSKPLIYNAFYSLQQRTTLPITFYMGQLYYSGIYTKLKSPAFTANALTSTTTTVKPGLAVSLYNGSTPQPFSTAMRVHTPAFEASCSSFDDGTAIGSITFKTTAFLISTVFGRFKLKAPEPSTWYTTTRYFSETWTQAGILCIHFTTSPLQNFQIVSTTYGGIHQSPFAEPERYWMRQESIITAGPLRLELSAFAQDTYLSQQYHEELVLTHSVRLHTIAQGLGSIIYTRQTHTNKKILTRIGTGTLYTLKQDQELYTNKTYNAFYMIYAPSFQITINGNIKLSSKEQSEYAFQQSFSASKLLCAPTVKLQETYKPLQSKITYAVSCTAHTKKVPVLSADIKYAWTYTKNDITQKEFTSSISAHQKTKHLTYAVNFMLNLTFY